MTKSRNSKTRNLVLAAAALLTLGTTALSSTEASAFGFRQGGFHHSNFGHHGYHWNHFSHYRYHYNWNYRRFSFGYRYNYRWPLRHSYWRGAAYGGPGAAMGSAPAQGSMAQGPAQMTAPSQAMAPARPACLAKQYTPEGAVMFIDRCTQESAISTPQAGAPQGSQQ